jgi:hypothetical protein
VLRGRPQLNPGIHTLPQGIELLLGRKFPDCLAVEGYRHSDGVWTLVILDLDYSYTVWLACLSLDQRWTLSPRPNAKVMQVSDMP